jgi:hypothetical protein
MGFLKRDDWNSIGTLAVFHYQYSKYNSQFAYRIELLKIKVGLSLFTSNPHYSISIWQWMGTKKVNPNKAIKTQGTFFSKRQGFWQDKVARQIKK